MIHLFKNNHLVVYRLFKLPGLIMQHARTGRYDDQCHTALTGLIMHIEFHISVVCHKSPVYQTYSNQCQQKKLPASNLVINVWTNL